MTDADDIKDIDTQLAELETKLAGASATFAKDIETQHKELSTEFHAADTALEELAQGIEKGDENLISDEA